MRGSRGFSLLQVLTVLAIVAVVMSFALPAWSSIVRGQVVKSYIARLNVLLLRARNDALLKQASVHVCAANLKSNLDLQGCFANPVAVAGDRHWQEGVLVYQDKSGGRATIYDSKEALLVLPVSAAATAPQLLVSVPRFEIGEWGGLKGTQSVHFTVKDQSGICQQLLVSVPLRTTVLPC